MLGTVRIDLLGIAAGRGAAAPGAEDGPRALRRAGLIDRLSSAGLIVSDLGDIPGVYETRFAQPRGPGALHVPNVVQVNRHTHACVLGTRRKSPGSILLVVGGDHSLAIGVLAGLSDACSRLGVIWMDAHADLNTPESSPSGNIHGMSLAVACGHGLPELRSLADRDPLIDESDVVLLGCRDIDPGEQALIDTGRFTLLTTSRWRERGIAGEVASACRSLAQRCDHVHLSFDIDVVDPQFAPGTGTPAPAGITRDEALAALRAARESGVIGSAEFVEYNPKLDHDAATAELTIDLIAALLVPPVAGTGPCAS